MYLARELAKAGFRVRHVVGDAEISRTPEGVEVVPLPPGYQRRGLARRKAILDALRSADGSVYIQRTAGIETGFAGAFAKLARRRFVFSASSDADFLDDPALLKELAGGLEVRSTRAIARLGVRLATAVVAQTDDQARLARMVVGARTRVIRSFCDPLSSSAGRGSAFLWIGAFAGVKDPLSYVALAERLPDLPFVMVADERAGWHELAAATRERASRAPNLELLPPVPRADLLALYERAIAVVGTSLYEGFPNTFLEGWARGVPALSFRIDADGLIERLGLGVVAHGSLDAFAAAARRYHDEPSAAAEDGAAGHRYVVEAHAPSVVGPQWVELVAPLVESG